MFWLMVAALGCDTGEGSVIEETREFVKAVEKGKPLKRIGKQAQDVIDAVQDDRREATVRIEEAEKLLRDVKVLFDPNDAERNETVERLARKLAKASRDLADSELADDARRAVEAAKLELEAELERLRAEREADNQ